METKTQTLRDLLASHDSSTEPNLELALRTVFGDPQLLVADRDHNQKAMSEVPDLQRRKEKLENTIRRTADVNDPERQIAERKLKETSEKLAVLEKRYPELAVKNTEVYVEKANEWIAWARKESAWYTNLSERTDCNYDDALIFARIAGRYDDTIADVEKLCKCTKSSKTRFVMSERSKKYDHRRMLESFVEDVESIVSYYRQKVEMIERELTKIKKRLSQTSQSQQLDHSGKRRRRKHRR